MDLADRSLIEARQIGACGSELDRSCGSELWIGAVDRSYGSVLMTGAMDRCL